MDKNVILKFEQLLARLVSFKTYKKEYSIDVDDEFNMMKKYIFEIATKDNLKCKLYKEYLLIDNFTESQPDITFFTHLDVVNVQKELWESDPFTLKITSEGYYGRGVVDDKGAFCILYTLITNVSTKLKVRIMAGFHEETSFACIKSYLNDYGQPSFGIVTDAKFPVIYGEKGSAYFIKRVKLKDEIAQSTTNSKNIVPENVITNLTTYYGRSSHSSKANIFENSIYKFLVNSYLEQIDFINKLNFTTNLLGKTIINPTMIVTEQKYMNVYFDVRFTSISDIMQIEKEVKINVIVTKREKCDEHNCYIEPLMEMYQQVTGDFLNVARTSTAGTYSAFLNNSLIYGFQLPFYEANVHIENEFLMKENVVVAYKIYKKLLEFKEKNGKL